MIILHTIKQRKANWISHILHRNCLLIHVIEGTKNVTGGQRRRRKQVLHVLNLYPANVDFWASC
jgi:hypothetical protein